MSLKKENETCNFYVDNRGYFIQSDSSNKESVLLDSMTKEFDGLCDENSDLHFLIQSAGGELIYLKYDNTAWRKYIIFRSREKNTAISNIHLVSHHDSLCAFYAMEHKGRILMIKHCFSLKSLYTTPDVAALLDARKCFCICKDDDLYTHLYYRNTDGSIRENVYNAHFELISENATLFDGNIYSMAVCCADGNFCYAYTTTEKEYTVLKFRKKDSEEKIITFGIARNCPLSVSSEDGKTEILWQEGKIVFSSVSFDNEKHFSKPKIKGNVDSVTLERTHNKTNHSLNVKQIKKGDFLMNNIKNDFNAKINAGISPAELTYHLGAIEKAVEKLCADTEKICTMLDKLVNLKNDSEIAPFPPIDKTADDEVKITQNDIGEVDEENMRLFEKM